MKIGTMEFDRPVMLAPMAGVTDLPYRLICKEMGCDYMVTEMVSAKAVLYNNKTPIFCCRLCRRKHHRHYSFSVQTRRLWLTLPLDWNHWDLQHLTLIWAAPYLKL